MTILIPPSASLLFPSGYFACTTSRWLFLFLSSSLLSARHSAVGGETSDETQKFNLVFSGPCMIDGSTITASWKNASVSSSRSLMENADITPLSRPWDFSTGCYIAARNTMHCKRTEATILVKIIAKCNWTEKQSKHDSCSRPSEAPMETK